MGSNQNDARVAVVAAFDSNQIQHLLYGLAYAKTIATVSKVDFRHDYLFNSNPSAVTFGENFNAYEFKRWVRKEYEFQLKRLDKAVETMSAGELATWIFKQWEIRQRFYRNYQETTAEFDKLNKGLQDLQLLGARFAAISLLASQFALIGLGVAPTLATGAQASMVGWSGWATASGKMALGIGSGLSIAIAQNWSTAQNADIVLVGKACTSEDAMNSTIDSLKSGIPGFLDDLLAPAINSMNATQMLEFNKVLERMERMARNAQPKKAAVRLQKAEQFKKAGPGGTGMKGAVSKSLQGLGYLLSAKSLFDSSNTFVNQWNGNY